MFFGDWSYLECFAVGRDRADFDVTGVKDDFGDFVGDGFQLELGRASQGLCAKVDGEVEVDMVRLELVDVRLRGRVVWHDGCVSTKGEE